MSNTNPTRRKTSAKKLEPIDWHEFANDAVLNGNMSTLYQRPVNEDPSAYASSEALVEIEKRQTRSGQAAEAALADPTVGPTPTVGFVPTVSPEPTGGSAPTVGAVETALDEPVMRPTVGTDPTGYKETTAEIIPTVGTKPTVGALAAMAVPRQGPQAVIKPAVVYKPTVGIKPTAPSIPTVGPELRKKIKPIRDVQDALTLAGHVLYKAMYGAPDGARAKSCAKGYRQLAAETHLDKDTVRDLICEFKEKGIVREIGTYDPDTRSAKTYEVLSYKAILQAWRDADLQYVTTGRKRPMFCTASGDLISSIPTVGTKPTVGEHRPAKPTVGLVETARVQTQSPMTDILSVLQQITGAPVDQEAADRLVANCRAEAPDCTLDEIIELAWSRAFLCRSGKIDNPIGFLITQVPKFFQGEALASFRFNKRKELEAAAQASAREEDRRREAEREIEELEEAKRLRHEVAERHRSGQGIDLKAIIQDAEADDILKQWASRLVRIGYRYQPEYA